MLDAQDLHVTFNPGTPIENPVLRGMTLSIPEGEFVSVIGSNGAGKSTFLNAIAGDLRVDSRPDASTQQQRIVAELLATGALEHGQ